ncbi:MAG TPA: PilN domain-containing protein [Candidatus Eremiobacteraceae bacterium]|nr:PilN domain-containing protein [Candidatus Eremiobacteraceae bacterium]
MIDINLLPSAQRRTAFTFDRIFSIGLMLLALEFVGLIAFDLVENMQINKLNGQIADWTQRVAVVQEQVKEVDDLRDQVADLRAKADLLERIKQSPLQVAEILTDVGNNTPPGVWYNTMAVVHQTDGGTVTLSGDTSTYREVADLMLNLDGSPIFGDASLTTGTQQVTQQNPEGGDVQFSLVGTLSPAVIGQ